MEGAAAVPGRAPSRKQCRRSVLLVLIILATTLALPGTAAEARSRSVALRFIVSGCDTAPCKVTAVWCQGDSGGAVGRSSAVLRERAFLRVPRAETRYMYFIVSRTDADGRYRMTNVVLGFPGIERPGSTTLTGQQKGRIFWSGATRPSYSVRLTVEPVDVADGIRAYQTGRSLRPTATTLDTREGANTDSEFCSP